MFFRIFYVLFLELCLSLIINIALVTPAQPLTQLASFMIAILVVSLMGFLAMLLFCSFGYGPLSQNLYERWSFWSSLNEPRQLRDKECLIAFVKSNKSLK